MSARAANERSAHRYADTGWPVFPCVPGEKVPAIAHGLLEASTDHRQIEAWWGRNPERNVAIATGAPGPDVLDIDNHGPDASGFAGLNRIKREGLADDPRAIIRTPNSGLHLYFGGTEQRNGKIPGQHIDFRAQGGYVLAPTSQVGGRPYEVVKHEPSEATCDFGAVRKLLDPQPERTPVRLPERDAGRPRDLAHLAGWVAALPEGNRNDGLFWAANRAVEAGDDDALAAIAEAGVLAGLTPREVDRTIGSAARGSRLAEHQREAG